MLSQIFLGMSLLGAEWVLYFLVLLSILSVALIIERARFYQVASKGLPQFRQQIRESVGSGKINEAIKLVEARDKAGNITDLETGLAQAILMHANANSNPSPGVLTELAQDSVVRGRMKWERNLAILATVGSNAPFIGLFGTVLGIIKAFHDLSRQVATGAQTVTAGISEALVATAVGILVAIPAVVAFNLYQRRVKAAVSEAEALKSYLIGKLVK